MHLSYKSSKPDNIIFDYLSNMQQFVKVHPVIYRFSPMAANQFEVFEKMQLRLFSFSFRYVVTISSNADLKTVKMNAYILKVLKVDILFNINREADYTLITERVIFRSLLPVKPLMKVIFKKYHHQLFQNIEKA